MGVQQMKHIPYISLLSLLVTMSLTGCASISGQWSDPGSCFRYKCEAHKAWHRWRWCYDDVDHRHHFARGFKAGYRDVLEGGKGCQPTIAPRCYWKSCYQTAEGQAKVNAWFDGFSHGALAAQQDGVGHWNQIPLSPTARMNLRVANSHAQPSPWHGHGPPPPVAAPAPPNMPQPLLLDQDDDEMDEHGETEYVESPADQELPVLRPYE